MPKPWETEPTYEFKRIRFKLDKKHWPLGEILEIDFSDGKMVVVAGKNGTGKSLLLQSIHRLTECMRNCYSDKDYAALEFKQWFSATPIELLEIELRNTFDGDHIDDWQFDGYGGPFKFITHFHRNWYENAGR